VDAAVDCMMLELETAGQGYGMG